MIQGHCFLRPHGWAGRIHRLCERRSVGKTRGLLPMNIASETAPSVSSLYGQTPPDMPIPNRLNSCLVVAVLLGACGLLWLGSHVETGWATLGVGVVFSYLLLTNYALFHEAGHGN